MPAASFSCLSHDVKVVGISQFVYLENISIKSKHVFSVHFVRLCSCLISLKNSSRVCLFGGLTFGFVGTAGLARSVMCSGVRSPVLLVTPPIPGWWGGFCLPAPVMAVGCWFGGFFLYGDLQVVIMHALIVNMFFLFPQNNFLFKSLTYSRWKIVCKEYMQPNKQDG